MMPQTLLTALRQAPVVERKGRFAVFLQDEMPVGLWMVEAGELYISRTSGRGKTVILDVLEPGELAGLASAVADIPYETAAETSGPCRLRLLARAELLRILRADIESSNAVVRMLAEELAITHRWIGNTSLARSGSA